MEKYYEFLKKYVSEKRYQHSLRTAKMAEKLCDIYNIDKCAVVAALLHDVAKELSLKDMKKIIADEYKSDIDGMYIESILHGYAGSILCREELGITNPKILSAIAYHTTGKKNMTDIEKVVYISDAIEEGRNYENVDKIREKVFKSLNDGILSEIDHKLRYLLEENKIIHVNTIKFRNSLLEGKNDR